MARGRRTRKIEVEGVFNDSQENVHFWRQSVQLLAILDRRRTAHCLAVEQMGIQYLEESSWERGFNAVDEQGVRYQLVHDAGVTVEIAHLECEYVLMPELASKDKLGGLWRMSVAEARSLFRKRPNGGRYETQRALFKEKGEKVKVHASGAT